MADEAAWCASLPWEEDKDVADTTDFKSPGDFVVKTINLEFLKLSKNVVEEAMHHDELNLARVLSVDSAPENPFARLLQMMATLSQFYLESLVSALMSWRQMMRPKPVDNDQIRKKIESLKGSGKIKDKEVPVFMEERKVTAIDHIFAVGVHLLLGRGLNEKGDNLAATTAERLEQFIFEYFKTTAVGKTSDPTTPANQVVVKDTFARILGVLSYQCNRVANIVQKGFATIDAQRKTPLVVAASVYALRFVKLDVINRSAAAEKVVAEVNKNFKKWSKKWGKEKVTRKAFTDMLSMILIPTMVQPRDPTGNYSALEKQLVMLHDTVQVYHKKNKHIDVRQLSTTCLCAHSIVYFLKGYETEAEVLLSALQETGPKRTIALEMFYVVCVMYFVAGKGSGGIIFQNFQDLLEKYLYTLDAKKPFPTHRPAVDLYVDVFGLLAMNDREYIMDAFIKRMVKPETSPGPEAMIIGIGAFMSIVMRLRGHPDVLFVNRALGLDTTTALPHLAWRKDRLDFEFKDKKEEPPMKDDDVNHFNAAQGEILASTFGKDGLPFLLSTGHAKGLKQEEQFDLLLMIVYSLRACLPKSHSTSAVLMSVCHLTVHSLDRMRVEAESLLKYLMEHRPCLRSTIVQLFARFTQSIPDRNSRLLLSSIRFLLGLISQWSTEIRTQADRKDQVLACENIVPVPFDANEIEAVALVFLCHHSADIRQSALRLIETVEPLCKAIGGEHASKSRLANVIRTKSTEIFKESECQRVGLIVEKDEDDEKKSNSLAGVGLAHDLTSLPDLAAADGPGAQQRWARVLGLIMRAVSASDDQSTGQHAWLKVCPRIRTMHHAISTHATAVTASTSRDTRAAELVQWRNYLAFAIGGCQAADSARRLSSSTQTGTVHAGTVAAEGEGAAGEGADGASAIHTSADLIRLVLPILLSASPAEREPVQTGFLFLPPCAFLTMVRETQQQCPWSTFAKQHNKRDKARSLVMLSFAYRVMAENKPTGMLSDNAHEGVLKAFLEGVRHLVEYPSMAPGDNPLDLQLVRYELTRFFLEIIRECNENKWEKRQKMGEKLHDSLLKFLVQCCGHSPTFLVQQDQDGKAIDACVALKQPENRAAYLRTDESVLRPNALVALAAFVEGPSSPSVEKELWKTLSNVFRFAAPGDVLLRRLARKCIRNLVRTNEPFRKEHAARLIKRSYSHGTDQKHQVASGYFTALVEVMGDIPSLPLPVHVLLNVCFFKIADSVYAVRNAAAKLVRIACEVHFSRQHCSLEENTRVFDVYQRAQHESSAFFASTHTDLTLPFITEFALRFENMTSAARHGMLRALKPWLGNLSFDNEAHKAKLPTIMEFLVLVTNCYGTTFVAEIEALWLQLALREENIDPIVSFFIARYAETRNHSLLLIAAKIVVLVSRGHPSTTIDVLASRLESVAFVLRQGESPTDSALVTAAPVVAASMAAAAATMWVPWMALFPPAAQNPPVSHAQVAVLLLNELALERDVEFRAHLPRLVHVCFLFADEPNYVVFEAAKSLLANLIHALVAQSPEASPEEIALKRDLVSCAGEQLWPNEDITPPEQLHLRSTGLLATRVRQVTDALSAFDVDLADRWASEALHWATTENVPNHYVSRCLQVYRTLRRPLTPRALSRVLHCMTNTVNMRVSGRSGIAIECLTALHDAVAVSDVKSLPQLVWTAATFLHTDYHAEYRVASRLMLSLLEQYDLESGLADAETLLRVMPARDWVPSFGGLLPLSMKGLTSASTCEDSERQIARYCVYESEQLVSNASPYRIVDQIVSLLPLILSGADARAAVAEQVRTSGPIAHRTLQMNGGVSLSETTNSDYSIGTTTGISDNVLGLAAPDAFSSVHELARAIDSAVGDGNEAGDAESTRLVDEPTLRLAVANLYAACSAGGLPEVAAVFSPATFDAFTSLDAFVEALVLPFTAAFFPQHDLRVFSMLTEIINKGRERYKRPVLRLFRSLFRQIDFAASVMRTKAFSVFTTVESFLAGALWDEVRDVLEHTIAVEVKRRAVEFNEMEAHPLLKQSVFNYSKGPSTWDLKDKGKSSILTGLKGVIKSFDTDVAVATPRWSANSSMPESAQRRTFVPAGTWSDAPAPALPPRAARVPSPSPRKPAALTSSQSGGGSSPKKSPQPPKRHRSALPVNPPPPLSPRPPANAPSSPTPSSPAPAAAAAAAAAAVADSGGAPTLPQRSTPPQTPGRSSPSPSSARGAGTPPRTPEPASPSPEKRSTAGSDPPSPTPGFAIETRERPSPQPASAVAGGFKRAVPKSRADSGERRAMLARRSPGAAKLKVGGKAATIGRTSGFGKRKSKAPASEAPGAMTESRTTDDVDSLAKEERVVQSARGVSPGSGTNMLAPPGDGDAKNASRNSKEQRRRRASAPGSDGQAVAKRRGSHRAKGEKEAAGALPPPMPPREVRAAPTAPTTSAPARPVSPSPASARAAPPPSLSTPPPSLSTPPPSLSAPPMTTMSPGRGPPTSGRRM